MAFDILYVFGGICYLIGRFLADVIHDLVLMADEKKQKKAEEEKYE